MANPLKIEKKINEPLKNLLQSFTPSNQIPPATLSLLDQKFISVTNDITKLSNFFLKLFKKHPQLFTPENVDKIAEFAHAVHIDLHELQKVLEEKAKLMAQEKVNMRPKTR